MQIIPNPNFPVAVLHTKEYLSRMFALGRLCAIAWYVGRMVYLHPGPLHHVMFEYLTIKVEEDFLTEKQSHYTHDFWKHLEVHNKQFECVYGRVSDVTTEQLRGVFEYFGLDFYLIKDCAEVKDEVHEHFVKVMRRLLWVSVFGGTSFLTMAREFKKGWNVASACTYLTDEDFEYLFTSTCEVPLDALLYNFDFKESNDALTNASSNKYIVLRNLIYALTIMKPMYLKNFTAFLYGAPTLPTLTQDNKWAVVFDNISARRYPNSNTCMHKLYLNVHETHGHMSLQSFLRMLEFALLKGMKYGPT